MPTAPARQKSCAVGRSKQILMSPCATQRTDRLLSLQKTERDHFVMNNLPKISIVIPAYNVAPYIGETLESVFAQTFDDFEVILVNDGSPDTDEFERVLGPYRERIRYVKQ